VEQAVFSGLIDVKFTPRSEVYDGYIDGFFFCGPHFSKRKKKKKHFSKRDAVISVLFRCVF
jgi:hypothetical protein